MSDLRKIANKIKKRMSDADGWQVGMSIYGGSSTRAGNYQYEAHRREYIKAMEDVDQLQKQAKKAYNANRKRRTDK
jgi:hypothetical protein